MVRRLLIWTAVPAAIVTFCGPAPANVKQVPVVRIHAQTTVAATPAAVWRELTSGKSLVTWCPVWKSPGNAKMNLSKVGDVLDYTDEWGHGGRSIVTYLIRDKELRIAHEPNDGSYLCQAKINLSPSGAGTAVHYTEQYTDESAPQDLEATAQKMQAEMDRTLAALKKAAEAR